MELATGSPVLYTKLENEPMHPKASAY